MPIDINALSADDAQNLSGAPSQAQGAAPLGPQNIDISKLSAEDASNLAAPPPMGSGEAAARLFAHHLAFGLADPLIGKQKIEQAQSEHPYIDFATGAAAMVPQTMALGPLAAAGRGFEVAANAPRLAEYGAQAVRGLGKVAEAFVPNTGARTAGQAARTGAKIGASYSGAETLGTDVTDPNKSWVDTAGDVASATGVGAGAGAVLGAGAHGASRAVGAIGNRILPSLREARQAANAPEAKGIRDIWRQAGYDDADLAQLDKEINIKSPNGIPQDKAEEAARLAQQGVPHADIAAQTGIPEPAVANIAAQEEAIHNRYSDLNLVEALKMGKLEPTSQGQLKPQIVTTKNLNGLMQDSANTEGRGQNMAAEAFASRKSETSAKMQEDIDRLFGSGDRDADATALNARRAAIGKRYEKLKKTGDLVNGSDLTNMQNVSPVFKKALQDAVVSDAIRSPESHFNHLWDKDENGNFVIHNLSPSNILDIHHSLVLNAKPSPSVDPSAARQASQLKSWFSDWVDSQYPKHKGMRQDFTQFKRIMDAQEMGANLPLASGGKDHKSLQFLSGIQNDANDAQKALNVAQAKKAFAAQEGKSPGSLNSYQSQINKAQDAIDRHNEILDEYRKSWGDSIKQDLSERGDNGPNQVVRNLTTQEGQRRLTSVLGPDKAKEYIQSLYNKDMQGRLGNTLYGGPDTAYKAERLSKKNALWKAASGAMHLRPMQVLEGLGEVASKGLAQRGADAVNETLSQQGVPAVRGLLKSAAQQDAVRTVAQPYVRNPMLNMVGPVGAEVMGQYNNNYDQSGGLHGRQTLGPYAPYQGQGHALGGQVTPTQGRPIDNVAQIPPPVWGLDGPTFDLLGPQQGNDQNTEDDMKTRGPNQGGGLGKPIGKAGGGGILEDAENNPYGSGSSPLPYDPSPNNGEMRGTGYGESRYPYEPMDESVEGQLAPYAPVIVPGLGAVGRGIGMGTKALGSTMAKAPVATGLGLGGLGIAATTSGAGEPGATTGMSKEVPVGPALQEQINQLNERQKQLYVLQANARADMEAEEKGTKKGSGAGKGTHYDQAQKTFGDLGAEIARNEMTLSDLRRRGTSEYATQIDKLHEAEQTRKDILDKSRKPFEEQFPNAAKYWWTVPALLAAATIGGKGIYSGLADRGAAGRWWGAVNAANEGAPAARTAASTLADQYATKTFPPPSLARTAGQWAGAIGMGGAEGALTANAPDFYNYNLPYENPEHRAYEEYKKRLPEGPVGDPERAKAEQLLKSIPEEYPAKKAAEEHFGDFGPDARVWQKAKAGAGEGMAGAFAGKTVAMPFGPLERSLPRAETEALGRRYPPSPPRGSLGQALPTTGPQNLLGLGEAAGSAAPQKLLPAEVPTSPAGPSGVPGAASVKPEATNVPKTGPEDVPDLPKAAAPISAAPDGLEGDASDYAPAQRKVRGRNGHIETEWGFRHKKSGRWSDGKSNPMKAKTSSAPDTTSDASGADAPASSDLSPSDADSILSSGSRNPKVRSALDAGDVQGAANLLGKDAGIPGYKLTDHIQRWIKAGKFD